MNSIVDPIICEPGLIVRTGRFANLHDATAQDCIDLRRTCTDILTGELRFHLYKVYFTTFFKEVPAPTGPAPANRPTSDSGYDSICSVKPHLTPIPDYELDQWIRDLAIGMNNGLGSANRETCEEYFARLPVDCFKNGLMEQGRTRVFDQCILHPLETMSKLVNFEMQYQWKHTLPTGNLSRAIADILVGIEFDQQGRPTKFATAIEMKHHGLGAYLLALPAVAAQGTHTWELDANNRNVQLLMKQISFQAIKSKVDMIFLSDFEFTILFQVNLSLDVDARLESVQVHSGVPTKLVPFRYRVVCNTDPYYSTQVVIMAVIWHMKQDNAQARSVRQTARLEQELALTPAEQARAKEMRNSTRRNMTRDPANMNGSDIDTDPNFDKGYQRFHATAGQLVPLQSGDVYYTQVLKLKYHDYATITGKLIPNLDPSTDLVLKIYDYDVLRRRYMSVEGNEFPDDCFTFDEFLSKADEFARNEIEVYQKIKHHNETNEYTINTPEMYDYGYMTMFEDGKQAYSGIYLLTSYIEQDSCEITSEVEADAIRQLEELHNIGILHGDLFWSSRNYFIVNGRIVFFDFSHSLKMEAYGDKAAEYEMNGFRYAIQSARRDSQLSASSSQAPHPMPGQNDIPQQFSYLYIGDSPAESDEQELTITSLEIDSGSGYPSASPEDLFDVVKDAGSDSSPEFEEMDRSKDLLN